MKVLYVATISNTVNAFLIPHIKILVDKGHEVDVAFNIEQEINPKLKKMGCKIHEISFQRTPFSVDNSKAYRQLKKIITKEKYDLVHTHTPVASAIVRLACKKIKGVKVLYTAHGFHFYNRAPLKNWALFYPIEKYLSQFTDIIITINQEDYERAQKKFHSKNVEYIPSVGLDISKIEKVNVDKKYKHQELNIPENSFVILSVGELNKNKNHAVIIKALSKINNPKIHYVLCGTGSLKKYLEELSKKFGVSDNVHLLGYRSDVIEICKSSDVFAFPSLREGLGMAALEAMASGLPLLTSNVHGIIDYSINGVTGFNYEPTDVDGFAKGIEKLYKDKRLRQKMKEKNKKNVSKYDIHNVKAIMEQIYSSAQKNN